MLAFGAHNAQIGRRHFLVHERDSVEHSVALTLLRKSLAGELMLAAGVIGLVAVLGMLSPMTM